MTIRLDHTIVPAKDKVASAEFFAEIFGLKVKLSHFAEVQINESLTFAFADKPEAWEGPGLDPGKSESQHYAFHVSDAEFDAIFGRIQERKLRYWADPGQTQEGKINHHDGGRGVYFEDLNGHLLEIITRPYGSGG